MSAEPLSGPIRPCATPGCPNDADELAETPGGAAMFLCLDCIEQYSKPEPPLREGWLPLLAGAGVIFGLAVAALGVLGLVTAVQPDATSVRLHWALIGAGLMAAGLAALVARTPEAER